MYLTGEVLSALVGGREVTETKRFDIGEFHVAKQLYFFWSHHKY
jgi:hypothetical protein